MSYSIYAEIKGKISTINIDVIFNALTLIINVNELFETLIIFKVSLTYFFLQVFLP